MTLIFGGIFALPFQKGTKLRRKKVQCRGRAPACHIFTVNRTASVIS